MAVNVVKNKTQLLSRKPRVPVEGLFCNYHHRTCMQNRLDGYEYCIYHILEDKNSPYKQCNFTSAKTGKRCLNAAPKTDKKDGFCFEHSRKAILHRQRAAQKQRPRVSPESLLEQLECYNRLAPVAPPEPPPEVNPNTKKGRAAAAARLLQQNRVIDYAESDSSESEPTLVDHSWRGDFESDAESIDSEQEDQLKHAGIYTAEETALILRDKLIRLQSLYIEQFRRLQYQLKERRRDYVKSIKTEKDALANIHSAKNDPSNKQSYSNYMAMKRYHKRFGKEALLHRQSKERRVAQTEGNKYSPSYPRCISSEDGERCRERTLPATKYCMEHIMNDTSQVLFQKCSFGNGMCSHVVSKTTENPTCDLHQQFKPIEKHYPPPELQIPGPESCDDEENQVLDVEIEEDDRPLAEIAKSLQSDFTSTEVALSALEAAEKNRGGRSEMDFTVSALPPVDFMDSHLFEEEEPSASTSQGTILKLDPNFVVVSGEHTSASLESP